MEQLVGRVLVDVEEDDLSRLGGNQLTHKLAADRAAATRHKHALAGDVAHLTQVEHNLLAGKQVGDLNLAQRNLGVRLKGYVFHHGKRKGAHATLDARLQDTVALLTRGAGHGNNNLLNAVGLAQGRDVFHCAADLDAADALAKLVGVIVHENNGVARHIGVVGEHARHRESARLTGAHHKRAWRVAGLVDAQNTPTTGGMQAHQKARGITYHEHNSENANGTGQGQELTKHQEVGRIAHDYVEHNGNDDAHKLVNAGILPQRAIHAQSRKEHEHNDCHARDERSEQAARRGRGQLCVKYLAPRADNPCRGNRHDIHNGKRNCFDDLSYPARACSQTFLSRPSTRRLCPRLYVHPSVACSKSPGRPSF